MDVHVARRLIEVRERSLVRNDRENVGWVIFEVCGVSRDDFGFGAGDGDKRLLEGANIISFVEREVFGWP